MIWNATETVPALQGIDVIWGTSCRNISRCLTVPSSSGYPTLNIWKWKRVWPSHYQKVRPVMVCKMMLNVDMATTAFYTEQSVYYLMCVNLKRPSLKTKLILSWPMIEVSMPEGSVIDYNRNKFVKEIHWVKNVVSHLLYKCKY